MANYFYNNTSHSPLPQTGWGVCEDSIIRLMIPSEIPPVTPDSRSLLPNELLRPNEFIFEPAVLARIRAWAEGKRILVVDYNGVLAGEDDEADIINPQAQETLVRLRDLGYTLVLWTARSRNETDGTLTANYLAEYFPLRIYRENYRILNSNQREMYNAAKTVTPWLDQDEKKHDSLEIKPIPLLLHEAGIIDDAIKEDYFQSVLRPVTNLRYPCFNISRFAPRYIQETQEDLQTDATLERKFANYMSQLFGPHRIDEIVAKFPPPPDIPPPIL